MRPRRLAAIVSSHLGPAIPPQDWTGPERRGPETRVGDLVLALCDGQLTIWRDGAPGAPAAEVSLSEAAAPALLALANALLDEDSAYKFTAQDASMLRGVALFLRALAAEGRHVMVDGLRVTDEDVGYLADGIASFLPPDLSGR